MTGPSSEPLLGDLEPDEALRPELLGPVGQAVELVAPVVLRAARHPEPLDGAGTGEGLELGGGEHVGELHELHAEAQVGLVDAEAVHGLVPRDAGDGRRPLAGGGLGGVEHRFADRGQHVVLVHEAHLGVELHELVLPVRPQVLVAQAPGDLEVAVDAGHHEQLLEQRGDWGSA